MSPHEDGLLPDREINCVDVGLAREGVRLAATTTAGHGALVAGSVGPYGACLGDGSEYNGKYIGSEGIYIIY